MILCLRSSQSPSCWPVGPWFIQVGSCLSSPLQTIWNTAHYTLYAVSGFPSRMTSSPFGLRSITSTSFKVGRPIGLCSLCGRIVCRLKFCHRRVTRRVSNSMEPRVKYPKIKSNRIFFFNNRDFTHPRACAVATHAFLCKSGVPSEASTLPFQIPRLVVLAGST